MADFERGYVQLPPDSTGKKSAAAGRLIINYDSAVSTFSVGDVVTGLTSGASMTVIGVHTEGLPTGEGQLYAEIDDATGTFINGENLQVSAITVATVAASDGVQTIYYQKSIMVDSQNPDRSARIDANGDIFTRFNEGSPALSTFGGIITESPETSRQYVYAYDERPGEFYDVEVGAGTLSYLANERAVLLDTNGTASGDGVTRQSHVYHPYQPGTMTKVMQTIQIGDTGKANVVRRWGYFDEENGLFWELDGTTLYAVQRSSTTGSVVDTRVAQANWNRDSLDGTIRYDLDVTKTNLYWMDFQWLGVGIVRFGVYENDGTKTTCHVFENPNNQTAAYIRQGTLPIRLECVNTGAAGSSSELKSICAVVQITGKIRRQFTAFGASCQNLESVTYGEGEKVLIGIRPILSKNGLVNHAILTPHEFYIASDGATSSGVYKIRFRNLCFTTGGTYTDVHSTSFTQVNHGITGFLGGAPVSSGVEQYQGIMLGGSKFDHYFDNFGETRQFNLVTSVLSDQVTRPEMLVTLEAISPGASGDFLTAINFNELVY